MATTLNLNEKDFPGVFSALNGLVNRMGKSPSTRPSIRKVAADAILTGVKELNKELDSLHNANQSVNDNCNPTKPTPQSQDEIDRGAA